MAVKISKDKVNLDDVLIQFKLSGRYYVVFIVLTILIMLFNIVSCHNYVFAAEKVNYRCVEERFVNDSCAALRNSTEVCSEWVYDNPHSFVAELACQEWKRTLVGSVHNFGYGVGLLFIGPLSDKVGRKAAIVMTGVFGGVTGILKSFVTNYWAFIVLEFLEAAFGDCVSPSFILMVEMVAHEKRLLTSYLCSFGIICGHLVLSLTAWLVPYWRHFLLVLYSPMILFSTYIFLLDESPRWLISNGKKDKAVAVLNNIAKKNKGDIDKNVFDQITSEENKGDGFKKSLKNTFTSVALLKRFIMCLVWWTSSTFFIYGLNINTVMLQGNKYVNYALVGAVELPAKLSAFWILTKFRRKIPLIVAFFIAAIICFAQPFTPNDMQWLSISLVMAAKFMSSLIYSTIYMYTSEIFPTNTRNSMHALCSGLGRGGSTLAPLTPLLLVYWHGLPFLVFGAVTLVASLVTLLAPDTADDALPDTVLQAEAIGHKQPPATEQRYTQKETTD